MSLMLTLHIAFLLIWSGTLLYFPRLLTQQTSASDTEGREQALKMQHGLYAFVMTPSGLLTIVFGSWMLFERGFSGGWLPVKLALVLMMVFFHLYCGVLMERHKQEPEAAYSPWFYRLLLVPPVLLIPAVITLVVQKPF